MGFRVGAEEAAGVDGLQGAHDLHYLAGGLMLANSYPMPTLAEILGHAPAVLMKAHVHAIPQHVVSRTRNMADVLPWIGPAAPAETRPAAPAAVHSAVPTPLATPGTSTNLRFTGS